jgi:hypothetical protein
MSIVDALFRVHPVNSSKASMYIKPVIKEKQFEKCSLEYNWFSCGKPSSHIRDGTECKIIELSKRTSFFDPISGVTYKIRKDIDKCRVMIVDTPKECNVNKMIKKIIAKDFQGIVYKKNIDTIQSDLVCSSVEFIFINSILENSNKCPYTDYCNHHANYNHLQNAKSSIEMRKNFIESFK